MKKEKTFKDEVIKIDDIILKIDEKKQYSFAVKRHFNGYAIWVDLNNERVPRSANNQYKKLVKITREPNMHGVLVPHRTLNDKLQVVMSKESIAKIEELTNIANDNPVPAVTVGKIMKWQNELNAIDCQDEAVKLNAKKELQNSDPIISATSKVVGLVKNFLDNLGKSGDVNKNPGLAAMAKPDTNSIISENGDEPKQENDMNLPNTEPKEGNSQQSESEDCMQ